MTKERYMIPSGKHRMASKAVLIMIENYQIRSRHFKCLPEKDGCLPLAVDNMTKEPNVFRKTSDIFRSYLMSSDQSKSIRHLLPKKEFQDKYNSHVLLMNEFEEDRQIYQRYSVLPYSPALVCFKAFYTISCPNSNRG